MTFETPFLLLVLALAGPLQDPLQIPKPQTIEAEVVGNILGQPLGTGTVADLALDDAFVHRVADRIIRASFSERYRAILKDPTTSEDGEKAAAQAEDETEAAPAEPVEPTAAANEPSTRETTRAAPVAGEIAATTPVRAPERRSLPGWTYALLGGTVLLVLVLAARGSRRSGKGARR